MKKIFLIFFLLAPFLGHSGTLRFDSTLPDSGTTFPNQPRPSHVFSDGATELSIGVTDIRIGAFGSVSGTTFTPIDPTTLSSTVELEENFVELMGGFFSSAGNFSTSHGYSSNLSLEALVQGQTIYAFGTDYSDPAEPEMLLIKYLAAQGVFNDPGLAQTKFLTTTSNGAPFNDRIVDIDSVLIGAVNTDFFDPNTATITTLSGNMLGASAVASPFGMYEIQFYKTLSPFGLWAQSHSLNQSQRAFAVDDDNDCVNILLEYAFNLNPSVVDYQILSAGTGTAGLPVITAVGSGLSTFLQAEFIRRKGSELYYEVQFSNDLQTWTTAVNPEAVTSIDANWERVIVQDDLTATDTPRRFGRVVVSFYN